MSVSRRLRPATLAGSFYEADPGRLRRQVEEVLRAAPDQDMSLGDVTVVVAPHAGHIYSGAVAGAAFGVARDAAPNRAFDRILILGLSHRVDFDGAALSGADAWATPLGEVPLDTDAVAELAAHPAFDVNDPAHDAEHSIEVELPFAQVAWPDTAWRLLPVALRRPPVAGRAVWVEPLARLIEARRSAGERWLIVASTDTYHGPDVEACRRNDERLAVRIENADADRLAEAVASGEVMACGWLPLAVGMDLAHWFGAQRGQVVMRSDSSAVAGPDADYVVGYIAAIFV